MSRGAVVTGAASGIGRALASVLVTRGDTVVVAGIDGEGAERAAGELARHCPGTATSAVAGARDAGTVLALAGQVRDQHGRLDVMVNNVGIGVGGDAGELTLAHWERVIDVNLRGVSVECTRSAVRHLSRRSRCAYGKGA